MINVDRTVVEAPTLTTTHRTVESLEALGEVFLNKCYICERNTTSPANFEIDHFQTNADDDSLRLEWTNLYLICGDCNKSRQKTTPEGGFMDPCLDEDDVESEIVYQLPPCEHDQPVFSAASTSPTQKVTNTIDQLNRMHYGTKVTKMKCSAFREVIKTQCTKLLSLMLQERNAVDEENEAALAVASRMIDQMLAREAPFTMLMRSVAEKYRINRPYE